MDVLFIGGTGNISAACAALALERGIGLTLLTRGKRPAPPGARQIAVDAEDREALAAALGSATWDAVVDFIAFRPDQLRTRVDLLRGRASQFVFIGSASAYRKPVLDFPVTESTPLENPFWDYACDKIACEEYLLDELDGRGFPVTVVRPSFTYGETVIPLSFNSWERPYTAVDRMRRGAPVVIPGDGTSLWQLTHNEDFATGLVGLLGNPEAIGEAFHITTDEVLDWNRIYQYTAEAAGVDTLDCVHVDSDFIAAMAPGQRGGLHGDKMWSMVLDNAKIKRFVPSFRAVHPYREGIRRSIAWYDAEPARRRIDRAFDALCDRLVAAREAGLAHAGRSGRSRG